MGPESVTHPGWVRWGEYSFYCSIHRLYFESNSPMAIWFSVDYFGNQVEIGGGMAKILQLLGDGNFVVKTGLRPKNTESVVSFNI